MSAGPQGCLSAPPERLGIIAGGGRLPYLLLDYCRRHGSEPFIIALKGQAQPSLYEGYDHIVLRLGAAGELFRILHEKNIVDVVMIGAVIKPSLFDLRPDFYAARFIARVGFGALGDDTLLTAIRKQMEKEGITVHGLHRFMPDLLMPEKRVGGPPPNDTQRADIQVGITASQLLGRADKGQCVLVRDGRVIGEEGPEGTDALITAHGAPGAILVKTCKPQQDKDIDLPTIGPETVRLCARTGVSGIAVQAGSAFLVDEAEVAELADRHNIFVTGITLP